MGEVWGLSGALANDLAGQPSGPDLVHALSTSQLRGPDLKNTLQFICCLNLHNISSFLQNIS